MKFLEIRKKRKALKEIIHYAKHVRHMHEDISDADKLATIYAAENEANNLRKSSDGAAMERAGESLTKLAENMTIPRPHAKIRENVEVLFVSIAAAMAIRAYFLQPFKIPTGSMQPTLYGITLQEESVLPMTNPLFKAINMVFFGERAQPSVLAKNDGYIQMGTDQEGHKRPYYQPNPDQTLTIFVDKTPHVISSKLYFNNLLRIGEPIRRGEPLARTSVRQSGDYILVNRLKYNFIRPKRGDIVVFDTKDLTHPQVRSDSYYIKRMVGLPGETISVAPKYLLVNGKKPTDKRFDKLFNNEDYDGYQFGNLSTPPPRIGKQGDSISLADDEYLFFGDNTTQSLDGRYFGAVNRRRILGPAFFVCWPLDRAGFAEINH